MVSTAQTTIYYLHLLLTESLIVRVLSFGRLVWETSWAFIFLLLAHCGVLKESQDICTVANNNNETHSQDSEVGVQPVTFLVLTHCGAQGAGLCLHAEWFMHTTNTRPHSSSTAAVPRALPSPRGVSLAHTHTHPGGPTLRVR